MSDQANILTIGTEITSGEIINSNAAWIAGRLEENRYVVGIHLSVPDERKAILKALKDLQNSKILVVCGGLGPTSDDITREMVAKWLGKPLHFSDKVWRDLEVSYASRGLPLREAHRHQCYFPKDAKLLVNPAGTALGFVAKRKSMRIFVVPGPPRELEAMWGAAIQPLLKSGRARAWEHWTLLGVPESEVAECVEPIIEPLKLDVGYRASVPYVYLKLRGKKYSPAVASAIDAVFKDKSCWRGKTDFVQELVTLWRGRKILIQDGVSRGILVQRLAKYLIGNESDVRIETVWGRETVSSSLADCCGQLLMVPGDPHAIDVVWRNKDLVQKLRFTLPYKVPVNSERGARSAAEWALFKWFSWIKA